MTKSTQENFIFSMEDITGPENDEELKQIIWFNSSEPYKTHKIYRRLKTDEIYRCIEMRIPIAIHNQVTDRYVSVFIGKKITDNEINLLGSFDEVSKRIEKTMRKHTKDNHNYDSEIGIDKSIVQELISIIDKIITIQDPLFPKECADNSSLAFPFLSAPIIDQYVTGDFN